MNGAMITLGPTEARPEFLRKMTLAFAAAPSIRSPHRLAIGLARGEQLLEAFIDARDVFVAGVDG